MNVYISELSLRSSAQNGGLSAYELDLARQLYPEMTPILDLVAKLQDDAEETESVQAGELRDLEEHYENKIEDARDEIRDICDAKDVLFDLLTDAGDALEPGAIDAEDLKATVYQLELVASAIERLKERFDAW